MERRRWALVEAEGAAFLDNDGDDDVQHAERADEDERDKVRVHAAREEAAFLGVDSVAKLPCDRRPALERHHLCAPISCCIRQLSRRDVARVGRDHFGKCDSRVGN